MAWALVLLVLPKAKTLLRVLLKALSLPAPRCSHLYHSRSLHQTPPTPSWALWQSRCTAPKLLVRRITMHTAIHYLPLLYRAWVMLASLHLVFVGLAKRNQPLRHSQHHALSNQLRSQSPNRSALLHLYHLLLVLPIRPKRFVSFWVISHVRSLLNLSRLLQAHRLLDLTQTNH